MSKTSNMLNMIKILKDKKVHSISKLAEELEVSERMIRVYKNELEQAGIYINSKKGMYGGYVLDSNSNNIDIGLSPKDINTLISLNEYIQNNTDFSYKQNLSLVIEKIYNAYNKNNTNTNNSKLNLINKYQNNLSNIYKDFRKAINCRNKVYIKYNSINSKETERIIHPAELFCYLDEWFISAFCELRKEIRIFKLQDILEYKILDEKYTKNFKINL